MSEQASRDGRTEAADGGQDTAQGAAAESPVRGAQEQVGSGECLDVVVVVAEQVGRGESVAVVVVVVVVLKAQFVEHKNKWETVSALMWLSWCWKPGLWSTRTSWKW